jgi:soluble lytic murein transglycosylase-like protein
VRSIALALLLAAAARPQTPQELSAAHQRQAVEQQAAALRQQDGALSLQAASVKKQRASSPAHPAPDSAAPRPSTVVLPVDPCLPLAPALLDPFLERAAASNSLAPALLRAVIRRESAFQPCAVSRAGALGLMQLMPSTAELFGVENPFDPAENISAGSRFLRQMLDRFNGDLPLALGAYNAGPSRVEAAGRIPAIPETQAYVQDILSRLR